MVVQTNVVFYKPLSGLQIPNQKILGTELLNLWVDDVDQSIQEFRSLGNVYQGASNDE